MRRKLRNNFLMLLTQKEQREGRRIRHGEVVKETGITLATILRWEKNEVNKFEGPVIEAFCDYFGCEVGDLLYLERGENTTQDGESPK